MKLPQNPTFSLETFWKSEIFSKKCSHIYIERWDNSFNWQSFVCQPLSHNIITWFSFWWTLKHFLWISLFPLFMRQTRKSHYKKILYWEWQCFIKIIRLFKWLWPSNLTIMKLLYQIKWKMDFVCWVVNPNRSINPIKLGKGRISQRLWF